VKKNVENRLTFDEARSLRILRSTVTRKRNWKLKSYLATFTASAQSTRQMTTTDRPIWHMLPLGYLSATRSAQRVNHNVSISVTLKTRPYNGFLFTVLLLTDSSNNVGITHSSRSFHHFTAIMRCQCITVISKR